MEAAPLSLAYSHARNALTETQKANPIAASEEHDLAAGEFANAAKSTGDPEALRTLRLLEQHHQRLAELLKYKPEVPPASEDVLGQEPTPASTGHLASVAEEDTGTEKGTNEISGSPRHSSRTSSDSRPHRELSSSIASNLASARGIQPRPQRQRGIQAPTSVTAHNADGKISSSSSSLAPGNTSSSRRSPRGYDRHSRPPPLSPSSTFKSPSTTSDPSHASPTRISIPPSVLRAQASNDDAFARFYTTVESLGSKLSAALAFTGLPLGAAGGEPSSGDANPASAGESEKSAAAVAAASTTRSSTTLAAAATGARPPLTLARDNSRTTPSGSPDVSRFFSRAALRAVREEAIANGAGPGVAESFYVVPTSGGTLSYRDMMVGAGARQASSGADDEEFVDAREIPSAADEFEAAPGQHSSRTTGGSGGRGGAAADDGSVGSRSRAGTVTSTGTARRTRGGPAGVVGEWLGGNTSAKADVSPSFPAAAQALEKEVQYWRAVASETGERLRAFEMNAQRESIMHASMFRHGGGGGNPTSPAASLVRRENTRSSGGDGTTATATAGGGTGPGAADAIVAARDERIVELEVEVERARDEVRRVARENKRLAQVVDKYRRRFDELKDGARERLRREDLERARGATGGSATPDPAAAQVEAAERRDQLTE